MENIKTSVDVEKLRELFLAAKLPGVATLVEDAARNSVTEFRPPFVDDPNELLLQVGNAVAGVYGFKLMSAAEIAEDLRSAGAEAKSVFLGTGFIIGPIATGPGKRIEITALQWFETLSNVMKDIAPEALAKFDAVCASLARSEKSPREDMTTKDL
jgi:hypothetical protein